MIPKNCAEGPYTNTCPAFHYLADGCKYKKINQSKGRNRNEFEKANLY